MPQETTQVIEQGDIFFFYRPRVGVEKVNGREDVQRLYLVLAPQDRPLFRVFVIGRKRMPEILPGKAHPEERNWALNVLTTSDPEEIRRDFLAKEYVTSTRGERIVGAAKPLAEGRYELLRHRDHTELGYVLELPEEPGPAQEVFGIQKEASYIVAVKNPDVTWPPGAPTPKEPPAYPPELKAKFGKHRWIDVDDPELLNYENTQIFLLGARAGRDVEEELGIRLDDEHEKAHGADVFRRLRIRRGEIPLDPLFKGVFPERETPGPQEEIERLAPEEAPGRGGRVGGKAAASRAPSAAAVARILGGIEFPKTKGELLRYAQRHRDRLEDPEPVLRVLGELPERHYTNMADVERALGEIR